MTATASSSDIDCSRWNIIYPHYINKNKSIPEGRRLALSQTVEDPSCSEMKLICEHLHIPVVLEIGKSYPRDWTIPGRLRYQLKDPTGSFYDTTITSRKTFMLKICELIPKLKSRAASASTSSASSSSSSGGGSSSSSSSSSAGNAASTSKGPTPSTRSKKKKKAK